MPQPDTVLERSWLWTALQALGIICTAIYVYLPAVHGGWLWDDSAEITANTLLRNWQGLEKIWFSTAELDYFPLKSTVQWVAWHCFGDNPTVYHSLNIITHLISALLIWRILVLLGVKHGWVGGLLFSLHPLTQESVGWISELKNTLSLSILLLAFQEIIFFEKSLDTRRFRYFFALGLFTAAMLCKSSVVMFPAVVLLYFWYKRGKLTSAEIKLSIPFFIVSLVLGLITVWFQLNRAIAGMVMPQVSLPLKFLHALEIVLFYISKSLLAIKLSPMYPKLDDVSFVNYNYLVALAFIILGIIFLVLKRAYLKAGLFSTGSFVLNCIPVMGFIPMSYSKISEVADHFAYLPLVSVVCLITAGLSLLYESIRASAIVVKLVVFTVSVLLCIWIIIQSHTRARIFENPESYWKYTLQVNPRAWGAAYNLGWYYTSKPNHLDDAIYYYEDAIKLKDDFFEAEENLAGILALLPGRVNDSESHFKKAIALRPDDPEVHNNYGTLLMDIPNRAAEAVEQFKIAVKLKPNYAEAHDNLAIAFSASIDLRYQALQESEIAAQLDPTNPKIQGNYANILAHIPGRLEDALTQYQVALKLSPDLAQTHFNYANKLISLPGRFEEGLNQYELAIKIKPEFAEALNNLALNLSTLPNRKEEALKHFEEAIRLKPKYAEAHFNYAEMLVGYPNRLREAINHYVIAVELRPDHFELYYKIAILYARLGSYPEAIDALNQLRRYDPDSVQARELYNKITTVMQQR